MTYSVLYMRHGKDRKEGACVSHQCCARAGEDEGAPGFCSLDSRKAFPRNIPAGLPLLGVGLAELSAIGDSGRKSSSYRATPCWADHPSAITSPATGSVTKRFRGLRTVRGTGQGEAPWVRTARNSASFSPTSQTVFICTNCGKHISCSCRQCRPVRSCTT